MGALQAREMASAIDNEEVTERQAIVWHLRSNCYPPVPLVMVDVAIEAIHLIASGDADQDIDLPEGVEFRGGTKVLPWQVVENFHLNEFLPEIDLY